MTIFEPPVPPEDARPELPVPPEDTPPEPRTIPVWVPFVAMLAALIVVNIFGAAVFGVLAASDPTVKDADDLPDAALLALTLAQDVVFVFAAWIAVKLVLGRATREDFALVRVRSVGEAVKWGAAVFLGFWVITVGLALIFGDPEDQALVTDIKAEDALGVLIAWGVLICIAAPFVEELFFRGFMFGVFARRLGVLSGALLVGAIFGLAHAPAAPIQVIALGAFGVGLCVLRWRTQSIIPPMALHALNNSITFGVVKDLDPALFAGVVAVSVGTVIAGGTALSSRRAPVAA